MQSQNKQLLAHLKAGHSITFMDAFKTFGVMHLPRRILDLKEAGHAISDVWETNGEKRFKRYYLERENA